MFDFQQKVGPGSFMDYPETSPSPGIATFVFMATFEDGHNSYSVAEGIFGAIRPYSGQQSIHGSLVAIYKLGPVVN